MIKCVIFDLGDTLISTSKGLKKTLREYPEIKELKKAGYSVTRREYDLAFARMNKQLERIKDRKKHSEYLPAYLIIKNLGIKPSWDLAKKLAKKFFQTQKKHTKLEPYAKETLDYLKKQGIVIGLISNAGTAKAKKWLKIFKLKKYFTIILISEDTGFDKSQITPFRIFLRKLNKNRKQKIGPEECLMVGNDVKEDASAKKTGMKTGLYLPNKTQGKCAFKPDYIIKNLRMVKQVIVKISKNQGKVIKERGEMEIREFKKKDAVQASEMIIASIKTLKSQSVKEIKALCSNNVPERVIAKSRKMKLFVAVKNKAIVGIVGIQKNQIKK